MKVLVTGATGYINKRLVYYLLNCGHTVYATVRDRKRLELPASAQNSVQVFEADFYANRPGPGITYYCWPIKPKNACCSTPK